MDDRHEIRDDDHVYARASSMIVAYDVKQGRTRRFTGPENSLLDAYR